MLSKTYLNLSYVYGALKWDEVYGTRKVPKIKPFG
jgi:hypothetical protein